MDFKKFLEEQNLQAVFKNGIPPYFTINSNQELIILMQKLYLYPVKNDIKFNIKISHNRSQGTDLSFIDHNFYSYDNKFKKFLLTKLIKPTLHLQYNQVADVIEYSLIYDFETSIHLMERFSFRLTGDDELKLIKTSKELLKQGIINQEQFLQIKQLLPLAETLHPYDLIFNQDNNELTIVINNNWIRKNNLISFHAQELCKRLNFVNKKFPFSTAKKHTTYKKDNKDYEMKITSLIYDENKSIKIVSEILNYIIDNKFFYKRNKYDQEFELKLTYDFVDKSLKKIILEDALNLTTKKSKIKI